MITRGFAGIPVWCYAVGLTVVGLLLTAPVSFALARASWTRRAPRPALVLWQAVCLAAGFSVVAVSLKKKIKALGSSILGAAQAWFAALFAGTLQTPTWRLLCGLAAATITAVLLFVLARTAALTVHRRRAHRQVLDVLTRPTVRSGVGGRLGTSQELRILDHRAAIAYTLPGWHSRVVLSAGLVALLTDAELSAVIEHERAHLRARHDLLVLPFQAWAVALGWVPGVRPAGASVAELTEMLADDVAAARTSRSALASALAKVALSGPAPTPPDRLADAPAIAATAVTDRVRRLLHPHPLSGWETAMVSAVSILLMAIPASVLLLRWN